MQLINITARTQTEQHWSASGQGCWRSSCRGKHQSTASAGSRPARHSSNANAGAALWPRARGSAPDMPGGGNWEAGGSASAAAVEQPTQATVVPAPPTGRPVPQPLDSLCCHEPVARGIAACSLSRFGRVSAVYGAVEGAGNAGGEQQFRATRPSHLRSSSTAIRQPPPFQQSEALPRPGARHCKQPSIADAGGARGVATQGQPEDGKRSRQGLAAEEEEDVTHVGDFLGEIRRSGAERRR